MKNGTGVGANHTAGVACSHSTTGVDSGSAAQWPSGKALDWSMTSDGGRAENVRDEAVEAEDPSGAIARDSGDCGRDTERNRVGVFAI